MNGVFTIDGSGTTVKFSRGNLQYKPNMGIWQFASHQYDIIGDDNENISYSYDGWIDLFGWATNGNSGNGTHYMPWDASTSNKYGNTAAPWGWDNLDSNEDWGHNIGAAWRTLTSTEWGYLLDTRSSGATVEGVSNARYTHIAITINAVTITGLLLFPDGYNQGTPTGVSWSDDHINKHEADYAATCTAEGWTTLEDAGCVFLPYAGCREGASVSYAGTQGYYWTATSSDADDARALHIPNTTPFDNSARHLGCSVRLVYVIE